MAIPSKKLRALVSETKKDRKFASSADAEDEDQEGADEEDGDEGDEDEEREADMEEEKGPTPEQVQAAVDAVDDGGDEEIMDLLDGVEDPEAMPDFVTDEGKWNKAKAAVQPRADELDEPLAVIAHVYKSMGGQFDTSGGDEGEGGGDEGEGGE